MKRIARWLWEAVENIKASRPPVVDPARLGGKSKVHGHGSGVTDINTKRPRGG